MDLWKPGFFKAEAKSGFCPILCGNRLAVSARLQGLYEDRHSARNEKISQGQTIYFLFWWLCVDPLKFTWCWDMWRVERLLLLITDFGPSPSKESSQQIQQSSLGSEARAMTIPSCLSITYQQCVEPTREMLKLVKSYLRSTTGHLWD